jgi:hypothetical protein
VMPATVRPSMVAVAATKTRILRRVRRMEWGVMCLPVGRWWRRPAGNRVTAPEQGNLESALQAKGIVTPMLRLVNIPPVPEM